MANILVVDDEVGIRELLSEILADEGHNVELADSATAARACRNQSRPDLVLLDIWMPDTDGISLLKEWSANGQLTMPVVMMSGHGTIDTAVEATRIGAMDFLEKPIALQKLIGTVKRALREFEPVTGPTLSLSSFGKAPALKDLRKRLDQIAGRSQMLFLRGAPGAMLELTARYLHKGGTPWLPLDAAALGTPLEALTQAADGVLFVPELGELSRTQQKNLAFMLDKLSQFKAQLITASTHPEAALTESGFDPALLARLAAVWLSVPSVAEYAEDIPEIATLLLAREIEARACPPRHFSSAALNALRNHGWSGNHEQLRNAIINLALTSLDEEITLEEAQRILTGSVARSGPAPDMQLHLPLREAREAFESAYFNHLLRQENGNMTRVAEKSGLERTHLYRKLKQLGIQPGRRFEE